MRNAMIIIFPAAVALVCFSGCGPSPKELAARAAADKQRAQAMAQAEQERQAKIAAVVSNEQAGMAAESSNNFKRAFNAYLKALSGLTSDMPKEMDSRIRERLLKAAGRMTPPPAIPEAAERFQIRAMALLKLADADKGYGQPIAEFRKAIRAAPWWGAAYYNLALVQEKAGDPASAIRNLNFYLLAEPDNDDSSAVRRKIIELEVQAEQARQRIADALPRRNEIPGAPQWVQSGTKAAIEGDARFFYSVGSVNGVRNNSLAKSAADARARSEMTGFLTRCAEGAAAKSLMETIVEKSGIIIDHWRDPAGGAMFSLCKADMAELADAIRESGDTLESSPERIIANLERNFRDLASAGNYQMEKQKERGQE